MADYEEGDCVRFIIKECDFDEKFVEAFDNTVGVVHEYYSAGTFIVRPLLANILDSFVVLNAGYLTIAKEHLCPISQHEYDQEVLAYELQL